MKNRVKKNAGVLVLVHTVKIDIVSATNTPRINIMIQVVPKKNQNQTILYHVGHIGHIGQNQPLIDQNLLRVDQNQPHIDQNQPRTDLSQRLFHKRSVKNTEYVTILKRRHVPRKSIANVEM